MRSPTDFNCANFFHDQTIIHPEKSNQANLYTKKYLLLAFEPNPHALVDEYYCFWSITK